MRCLEKDPKRRLRDIGDVRLEIEETLPRSRRRAPRRRLPQRLASCCSSGQRQGSQDSRSLSSLWQFTECGRARARLRRGRSACPSSIRKAAKSVPRRSRPMAGVSRTGTTRRRHAVALGARSGQRRSPAPRRTEDACLPFWSPDSSDLGFFSGVSLKRVSAAGGPVRIVVDYMGTYGGAGGTWAADGTIIFSGQFDLFRVPADGGAARVVVKPPTQDWSYYWPTFLPDGRRFLFTAKLWTRNAEASDQGIYVGSVDNPKIRAAPPGPFECRVCPARLSRLCPRRHTDRGAVRSQRPPA